MECDPAMASFNSTTNLAQSSLYDLSGVDVAKTKEVGKGEMLCICFCLEHVKGRPLDLCLLAGKEGEVMERKANFGGNTAVGLQGPTAKVARMLPKCEDIDASKSISSSSSDSSGAAGEFC